MKFALITDISGRIEKLKITAKQHNSCNNKWFITAFCLYIKVKSSGQLVNMFCNFCSKHFQKDTSACLILFKLISLLYLQFIIFCLHFENCSFMCFVICWQNDIWNSSTCSRHILQCLKHYSLLLLLQKVHVMLQYFFCITWASKLIYISK